MRPFTAVSGKIPGRTLLMQRPLWDRHYKARIAQMAGGHTEVPTFGEVRLGQVPVAGQKGSTVARTGWGALYDVASQGFDLLTEREQTKMAQIQASRLPVPTDAIQAGVFGGMVNPATILLASGAVAIYFATRKTSRRGRRRR